MRKVTLLLGLFLSQTAAFLHAINDIPAGGSFLVQGSSANGHVNIQTPGFQNLGTLTFESADGGYASDMTVTSGFLTNKGVLNINPGSGGERVINGDILNLGQFVLNYGLGFVPGHLFDQSGGTLDLRNAGINFDGMNFHYGGGNILGTLYLVNSSLTLEPNVATPVLFLMTGGNAAIRSDIGAQQTVWLQGNSRGGFSTLVSTNGFKNSGTIRMESADGGYSSNLRVDSGVLTNAGTINFNAGSGGERVIDADTVNVGFINVNHPGAFRKQNGTYINAGSIIVAREAEFRVPGLNEHFIQRSGTLKADGLFLVSDAKFTLEGGEIIGIPYLVNSTLATLPGGAKGSIMQSGGSSVIAGDIYAGQTNTLRGDGTGGHSQLHSDKGFQNQGTLRFTTADGGYTAGFDLPNGRFTNAASGRVEVEAGAGGPRPWHADLLNSGVWNINHPASWDKDHGVYDNNGDLTIAAGVGLNITGQSQVLNLNGGTVTVNGALDLVNIDVNYRGGAVIGTPYLLATRLNLFPTATIPGSFILSGADAKLSGDVVAGTTLTLRGESRGGHSQLTADKGFINRGTIKLETVDGGYNANFGVVSGALTNGVGGVFEVNPGVGGPRNFFGDLVNLGAFNVNWGFAFSKDGGRYENRGVFNIATNQGVSIGGQNQTFTQSAGELNIIGGMAVDSMRFNYLGGIIRGAPYLINSTLIMDANAAGSASFIQSGPGSRFAGNIGPTQSIWLRGDGRGSHSQLTSSNGFNNGGTITLESIDGAYTSNFAIEDGTLTNLATGVFNMNRGANGPRTFLANLINSGKFNVQIDASFSKDHGVYVNRGALNIAADSTLHIGGQTQTFIQEGGKLDIQGGFVGDGIAFEHRGGTISGTPFLINSQLLLAPGGGAAQFSVTGGDARLKGDILQNQTVWLQGSPAGGHSRLTATNGFRNSGTLQVESTGGGWTSEFAISSGVFTNAAEGTVLIGGGTGGPRSFLASVLNQGTFTLKASAGLGVQGGVFVNQGQLLIDDNSTASFNEDFAQAAGLIRLSGGAFNVPNPLSIRGGVFAGFGGISTSVTNFSVLSLGAPAAPGSLNVNGSYTQTASATLEADIFGNGNDQLTVAGLAEINGKLVVHMAAGVVPADNAEFSVLRAQKINGRFSSFDLPSLPGGKTWQTAYDNGQVILRVLPAAAGTLAKIKGTVKDATGKPVGNATVFAYTTILQGLRGDYFSSIDLTNLVLSRLDPVVDFQWGGGQPDPSVPADNFSVRWTGKITPKYTETYTFYTSADDGMRLFIDNKPVTDRWIEQSPFPAEVSGSVDLVAGRAYDIRAEFFEHVGGAEMHLSWSSARQPREIIPASQLVPSSTTNLVVSGGVAAIVTGLTDANGAYQLSVSNSTWGVGLNNLATLGFDDVANGSATVAGADVTVNFTVQKSASNLLNVTAQVEPAGSGTVSGTGSFLAGANVTLTAAPSTTTLPWQFLNWTEDGLVQSSNPIYTFTVNRPRQLIAHFVLPTFQLKAQNNPAAGGTVAGAGAFTYGVSATLTASPNFGYRFSNWTRNGTVIGTDPALVLLVKADDTVTANYDEANLTHVVSTASLPAGIANVSGTGTYNNGQTASVAAPNSLTNGPNVYTFRQFNLNGVFFTNKPSFTKVLGTTDATNLFFQAEYDARSITPLLVDASANLVDPIPATTNLVLRFRFDRSMQTTVNPVVLITNSSSAKLPVVPVGGSWSAGALANDTFQTPPIVLAPGMDGTNLVIISKAFDTTGAELRLTNVLTLAIDATPPVLSSIAATPDLLTALVTWKSSETAAGSVEFGPTTAYGSSTGVNGYGLEQSFNLNDLVPNTTYHYRVHSRDIAGNESVSGDLTFKTLPDQTAPDTTLLSGPQSGAEGCLPITFTWTGSDAVSSVAKLTYAVRTDGGVLSAFSAATSFTIPTLAPGTHSFEVVARDQAGNQDPTPAKATFLVSSTAPAISAISASPAQADATITWTTDKAASSQVEFGPTTSLGTLRPVDPRLVTSHSYTVSGLAPNTTYQFRVRSSDACSRETISTIASFTTKPAPDLQVTNLSVAPTVLQSGVAFTVRWTNLNSGAAATSGSWFDQVTVSNLTTGRKLAESFVAFDAKTDVAIAAGGRLGRSQAFQLPDGSDGAGNIQITVLADAFNNQFEENAARTGESNNAASITVASTLSAYPDLVVTNLVLNPSDLRSGLSVQASWDILNAGNGAARGEFSERVVLRNVSTAETLVDTILPAQTSGDTLDAGATLKRQLSFKLPEGPSGAGELSLEITPNQGRTVFEFNSAGTAADNKTAFKLASALPPYPDLLVNGITAPPSAKAGETITITWNVLNQGNADARGPWVDQIYLSTDDSLGSDQLIGTSSFTGTVAAGQTAVRTAQVTLPAFGTGNRWLAIRIDAAGDVFELNKANNVAIDDRPVNIPATLTLVLPSAPVAEAAANPAAIATVTRNTDPSSELLVNIQIAGTNRLTAPATVSIPAGAQSANFPLNVVNLDTAEGTQNINITAAAAGFASADGVVTVTDDDLPSLTITTTAPVIRENAAAGSVSGIVTRNTAPTAALTVNLSSSDTVRIVVPASVTIPAGQTSVAFPITAPDNTDPSKTTRVTITPSSAGFLGLPEGIDVLDDDTPTLTVTLSDSIVSEAAANPASIGTVTRSPVTAQELVVVLDSSDSSAARVPLSVTIPASQASATFPINVVNDDLLDGSQQTRIVAYVADALFKTAITQGSGAAVFTVTDDEGPALKLAFALDVISETGNTLATVTRNTPATNNLVVTLSSANTGEATVPATVTIPAGQSSATFTVTGVADGVQDGIKRVNITGAAAGYSSGIAAISVSDVNLPDLRVSRAALPARGSTEGFVNATWTVSNDGSGVGTGPWVDRIYLASSSSGEDQRLVGEYLRAGTLGIGQTYDRVGTVILPQVPGDYYLVVVTDADNAVNEGSKRNNTTTTTVPIVVEPAYRATVQTDATTVLAGTPGVLKGRSFKSNGDPVPFALVKVRILIKGTRRTIDVRTDASGNFETTFQPLPGEAGHVVIGADHPGVTEDPAQDEFSIYGMRFADSDLQYRLFPGTVVTGQTEVQNLGDLPLHGVRATIDGLPSFLTVGLSITNEIAGGSSAMLLYSLNAGAVPSAVRLQSSIKLTSQEGVTIFLPITVTIAPQTATLVANPGFLASGMTRGTQRSLEFELSNVGGAPSGPLLVRLPPVAWLSSSTETNLPSLAPGESRKIVLSLNPAADLPLERYDGSLVISGTNAEVVVPFQFRAISESRGDLQLTVDDDYTYYVAGSPKVSGAAATLTDPLTGAVIASGATDNSGIVSFTNVFEGTYQLQVSADKHSTFRSPISIVPGVLTKTNVFLDRQAVTYRWSVVPIEIEDHYKVILEPVFETEVPIPVVTIDNPMMIPVVVRGEDTQFEVRVTNHGLIAAEQVHVDVPQHPDFDIQPLVEVIDVLPAKSSLSIPIVIRAKATAQFASEATLAANRLARQGNRTSFTGCTESPRLQVKWSFVCGPDRRWRLNDADIIPVCVEKSCWEKIKDAAGDASPEKGDLASKGAALAFAGKAFGGALADCVDPCLGTIVSMAIGVGTRDVKGAVTAALGFGSCFCPSIPSIGGPTGGPTGGPSGGPGGGVTYLGGGAGSGPGFPYAAPRFWDISGCRPGQNLSGDHTFSAQADTGGATTTPGNVCARVRLRIEQEAVITRAAFLGSLEIDNDHADVSLSGIRVTLDIRDEKQNSANDVFGIRGPELKGLTAVDGTGLIGASASGSAKYTFIPTRDAAKDGPTVYKIGGTLRYLEGTNEVEVPLLPDTITVYPDPVLNLVYFQQRDVYADDPNTDEVEPSEPFDLGLLVKNTGKGAAINFKITSAQPKIIDNEKGLLIDFKIIGTQVGSDPATPSLSANVGRIESGQSKVITWQMTSTLQGKFIEYNARFEHEDSLGDKRLSLIDSVEVHELIHRVRADRPGDDTLPDFLVNDVADPDSLPDTIYLSDGSVAPVNPARNGAAAGQVSPSSLQVQVTSSMSSGWNYLLMPDPGPGYRLRKVVRSDGKEIRMGENAWTTDRSFPSSQTGVRRENLLHLLDYNGTGSYTLTYGVNDSVAPVLTGIQPISPFVQSSAVGSVDVTLSEAVDVSNFNAVALKLTRNGSVDVPLSGLTLTKVSDTAFRVNGLQAFTGTDGTYELSISGEAFHDFGGNAAQSTASVRWAKGLTAPIIVSLAAPSPALRNLPVSTVDVTFSKAIDAATFTPAAVSLTRDGGANLIFSGVTIVPTSDSSFRISGLGPVTALEGKYTLSVNAAAVKDTSGTAGSGSLSASWQVDATAPVISSLQSVATNPRSIVVPSLDVTFSEAIDPASFDYRDLTLTRNGGPNLVTSDVTVTRVSDTVYRISNFNWVSGSEGTYVLTVNGAGISDAAGNLGRSSVSQSWVMDTTKPLAPVNLAISPDRGSLANDGITSTQKVVLSGSLAETNLTVRITDLATGDELAALLVTNKTFSKDIAFATAGSHRLQLTATDSAGNVSLEAFFSAFIDLVGPTADFRAISPDPRNTALPSVDVAFSESVNEKTLGLDDFVLTRDGSAPINLSGATILFASSNTFRVSGLGTITDQPGLYSLSLNLTNVEDVAGNAGSSVPNITWRRIGPNTAPALAAISDKIIGADSLLIFTNKAVDADVPANTLTYSLAAGAPFGSAINPTNGVFNWRPTRAQAAHSYTVTVIVTDNGTPALSASRTFLITVTDYLELNVGSVIVPMGELAVIPLTTFSSAAVTNLSFTLDLTPDHLTNLVLEGAIADVGSASIQPQTAGRYVLQLGAAPGKSFQGSQQVGQLTFRALTNRASAFVPLLASGITAKKTDGALVETIIQRNGRAIVIGREPLLEAGLTGNKGQLVLYGNPGVSYQLQNAPRLGSWLADSRYTLTNYFQVIGNLPLTNKVIFYRGFQTQ